MMKNSLYILCCAAILSSCAALGKYKPVEEVADDLYGIAPLSDTSANLANLDWRDVFTDPCLQTLIDSALVRNTDLLAAYEHIQQAEAMLLGAKLAYVPTLGIGSNTNPVTIGKSFSEGSSPWSYNLNATASWQLTFFRLTNNLKSAKATKAQAEDYYQAVRSALIASVANNYFTILMLDSELTTALEMEQTWKESVETVVAMKEAGMTDQVAVSQYKANYNSVLATIVDLRNQITQAENAMALMLCSTPNPIINRGKLIEQQLPEKLAVGIPVQMLTLRPDVRASQRDLEIAHYTTRGAILNFFPSLSITGSFNLINPATGEFSPMSALTNITAGLVAPILNAGQNRANLKAAESRQREAKLYFNQTIMTAGNEVNNALSDYVACNGKAVFYANQVMNLNKARIDTEYLMKNSMDKTYLDVLIAYNSFFDAKLNLIANQAKKMQAVVSLYNALGGGAE